MMHVFKKSELFFVLLQVNPLSLVDPWMLRFATFLSFRVDVYLYHINSTVWPQDTYGSFFPQISLCAMSYTVYTLWITNDNFLETLCEIMLTQSKKDCFKVFSPSFLLYILNSKIDNCKQTSNQTAKKIPVACKR